MPSRFSAEVFELIEGLEDALTCLRLLSRLSLNEYLFIKHRYIYILYNYF